MDQLTSYVCAILLGVIIVFGVIGSLISIVVWSIGKRCQNMSCGNYFKLIAMCDIYSLIVSGIPMLLEISPVNIRLYDYSIFFCKFLPFSGHLGVQLSSWLTVCVTIERCISIYSPMECYYKRSKKRALFLFGLICVVGFILNVMPIRYYEIRQVPLNVTFGNLSNSSTEVYERCISSVRDRYFYRVWNRYISFGCFVVGLPPVLMFISNIISLVKLQSRYSETAETLFPQQSKHSSAITTYTVLIITIGVLNCIATLPIGYLYIQVDYFDTKSSPVLYRVAGLLVFLNSCGNAVSYCLIGKAFRKDLKEIFASRSKLFCRNNSNSELQRKQASRTNTTSI